MKNKILEILKNTDGYVSGESISEQLSLSRSMVWKYINKLRNDGYIINSVTNKGYKLDFCPDIISAEEIMQKLSNQLIGGNVIYTSETDSTNNMAKRNSDCAEGSVFIADIQTAGKGRLGRSWKSSAGNGIYMSVLIKPDISPEKISQITLVAGISVCMALREYGADAFIKWPNDIVAGGKKICGILNELSAEQERINYVVCGIGINVHDKSFHEEISDKATSLYLSTGKSFARSDIIVSVLQYFEKYYKMYTGGETGKILSDYKSLCITLDKDVQIIKDGKALTAKALDIDSDGALMVLSEGKHMRVMSGEVSVRGILGYC